MAENTLKFFVMLKIVDYIINKKLTNLITTLTCVQIYP